MIYTVYNSTLTSTPAGSSQPKWTLGGNEVVSAPLVVGQHVVVGSSSGKIFVLPVYDGSVISNDTLDYPVPAPDEMNVQAPLTGMAAANNHLFVPAGKLLIAY